MIIIIAMANFMHQLVFKHKIVVVKLLQEYTYLVKHNFTHLLQSLLKHASTAMSDHIADILQSTTILTYYND